MIKLGEYVILCEAKFGAKDFGKHDGKYEQGIVAKIIAGEPIYIGSDNKGDTWTCKDIDKAKELFKDINQMETPDEFNAAMKELGGPVWTKIFKGQVSGYVDGLASKNKGNAFESEYNDHISEYIPILSKIAKKDLTGYGSKLTGTDNVRRPLQFKGDSFTLGLINGYKTIGDSVADIKLTKGDDVVNLSLKSGPTTTFANTGVGKIFPKSAFEKCKNEGTYELPKEGELVLETFGIDKKRFIDVFVNYTKEKTKDKAEGNSVDNTDIMKKNKNLKEFLGSVIGYGYIMVHKIGKEIHYIDMTKENRDKLLSGISKSTIYYGGKQGKGKRVDILIQFQNMELKMNIRSKTGGIYPTHLLADYTINPSFYVKS